jgi:anthranilate/para-aminobenzoate synthase component I
LQLDLEAAGKLLHVPKEIAENLMIVDLVRHDLYSIRGSGNVSVPRLMFTLLVNANGISRRLIGQDHEYK